MSEIDSLAIRGRSHTRVRELLDARAPLLHRPERDLLLDAADALLFDEPEADEKLEAARTLFGELVDSGRWVAGPADDVMSALEGCRPLAANPE